MKEFLKDWGHAIIFICVQLVVFVFMVNNCNPKLVCLAPIFFIGLLIWANMMKLKTQRESQKILKDLEEKRIMAEITFK